MGVMPAWQKHPYLAMITLAALLPLLSYGVQGRIGFSLWDEGYLWYGVQRVILGEVPIRDFDAYDLARYYWSAAWMAPIGDPGVLALRISCAILQCIALLMGSYITLRSAAQPSVPLVALTSVTLFLWMAPYYKTADFAASLLLLLAFTYLLEKPVYARYVVCGIAIGFAATIGRNHGVYGLVAAIGALTYLALKRLGLPGTKATIGMALGILLGYSPMLLALLFIPGLLAPFWKSILYIFELGATNLPYPWPWWTKLAPDQPWLTNLEGLLFLALLVFAITSVGLLLVVPRRSLTPGFAAAALLSAPYAHYAFSRADMAHLALGIFPFLVGIITFASRTATATRWLVLLGLLAISGALMLPRQPFLAKRWGNFQHVSISGDELRVAHWVAKDLALLNALDQRFGAEDKTFLAAPYWPGAYAVLRRKAPTYEIYALTPRPSPFQIEEIRRIKSAQPAFVIVIETPLDGNDRQTYRNTHRLVHQFIHDEFCRAGFTTEDRDVRIFVPCGIGGQGAPQS